MTPVRELEPPIDATLVDQLASLWEQAFHVAGEALPPILAGEEADANRDFLYVAEVDGEVVGTTHLTIGRRDVTIGGLGEVAVRPKFRRRGLATALCMRARDRFRELGGSALFLGTVNPSAARVYQRLGWRRLAGSTVMACISDDRSPEEFIVDYFRSRNSVRSVSVSPGAALDRVPMIPLLLAPHDSQVLDANLSLYSTRYQVQNSCMGLYPRYNELGKDQKGAWFAAHAGEGLLVGLGSARVNERGRGRVDAMSHPRYGATWDKLVHAATSWAESHGASVEALVSIEDEEKLAWFERHGLRPGPDRETTTFQLDGRTLNALRLTR